VLPRVAVVALAGRHRHARVTVDLGELELSCEHTATTRCYGDLGAAVKESAPAIFTASSPRLS